MSLELSAIGAGPDLSSVDELYINAYLDNKSEPLLDFAWPVPGLNGLTGLSVEDDKLVGVTNCDEELLRAFSNGKVLWIVVNGTKSISSWFPHIKISLTDSHKTIKAVLE